MSLFFREAGEEHRAIVSVPWGNSTVTSTGKSMAAALRLSPVYAAISLISDALITLPLHAFRDQGEQGRVRVQDPLLVTNPSPFVDDLTWRCQYIASMLLRGNAYGYNLNVTLGRPQQIVWLNPDSVRVDETRDRPVYFVGGRQVEDGAITHVRAFTLPGTIVGLSPITLFRLQVEAGLGAARFTSSWFDNGAVPSSILKNTAKSMTQDQADIAKKRFKASVRSGDMLVIGNDWEYSALQLGSSDAKFIETAKLTANQIAAIYHVPAEEIGGETGSSLTYSTLEMNDLKLIRRAVMPWTVRLEKTITGHLPDAQYARFNLDAYARADLRTRMEAHRTALEIGLETQDEGRALEDRPPLTDEQFKLWAEHYKKSANTPSIPSSTTEPGGPKT